MRVKGNCKEMKSRRLDKGWENEDNNNEKKSKSKNERWRKYDFLSVRLYREPLSALAKPKVMSIICS